MVHGWLTEWQAAGITAFLYGGRAVLVASHACLSVQASQAWLCWPLFSCYVRSEIACLVYFFSFTCLTAVLQFVFCFSCLHVCWGLQSDDSPVPTVRLYIILHIHYTRTHNPLVVLVCKSALAFFSFPNHFCSGISYVYQFLILVLYSLILFT